MTASERSDQPHTITGVTPKLRIVARRLSSVRARTTLVAVTVVAAAMVVGALALIGALRASLTEGVENNIKVQLDDVASFLQAQALPTKLPASHDDGFTQVVGPTGVVLAASATLHGGTPVTTAHPGEEGIVLHHVPAFADVDASPDKGSEGPFLVLAKTVPVTLADGRHELATIRVGQSLQLVERGSHLLILGLSLGAPVLVILVGVLVWVISGRALRPVEAIRAEVADITGRGLHRRVPEPPSRDEVALLARTMNEMLDRLESSAVSQQRFVADASHELRSPLATLQATLEVAVAHPQDTIWPTVSADALLEIRQLHRLVEDLLVVAHLEQPGGTARREPVDLDEILLHEGRRRHDSTPVLDLHRVSGGRVTGDPNQLARMVRNLLDNAQRHAQSRVDVELRSDGRIVELVVTDDGPGIERQDRQRIFEPFARLDESRSRQDGGVGLGLAIVNEIVLGHRGTVEVLDSDTGARFVVRLPEHDNNDQDPATRW